MMADIPFVDDVINYISDHLIIFIIIFSLVGILLYSMTAVFFNKLNKEKYGKTTWMAWIPIFRLFLLGKLTIHWIFGIILVLGLFCCVSISLTIDGVSKTYEILKENIREPFMIIYIGIVVVLYVFAHIKLSNIRRSGKGYSSKISINSQIVSEYDKKYNSNIKENENNDFYNTVNVEKSAEEMKPKTLKDAINDNAKRVNSENNEKKP